MESQKRIVCTKLTTILLFLLKTYNYLLEEAFKKYQNVIGTIKHIIRYISSFVFTLTDFSGFFHVDTMFLLKTYITSFSTLRLYQSFQLCPITYRYNLSLYFQSCFQQSTCLNHRTMLLSVIIRPVSKAHFLFKQSLVIVSLFCYAISPFRIKQLAEVHCFK